MANRCFSTDCFKTMVNIGTNAGIYEVILLKFEAKIDITKLHILTPVLVTLSLSQDCRVHESKHFCASYLTKFYINLDGICCWDYH